MAVEIVNYIRERIQQLNPEIDIRPGSVVSDLLINPLVSILEDYTSKQDLILNNQSLEDLTLISEDAMDAIAANFLVERNTGVHATGTIVLYFNEPRTLTIPSGSQFSDSTGSIVFETSINYSMTQGTMALNRDEYPYYNTGPIAVRGTEQGSQYNVSAGSIVRNLTLAVTPARIVNLEATSAGQDRENNTEFYERIITSFYNPTTASIAGIEKLLADNFSLTDVVIVGAGDEAMKRDIVEEYQLVDDLKVEDYYLVYSGEHTYPSKEHLALTGNFVDIDETEQVGLPSPTAFSGEFSNELYKGLYFKDDPLYSQEDEYTIVQEYFEDVGDPNIQYDLQTVLASGQWTIHDGTNPTHTLYYIDEINVENGYLRLGKEYDFTNLDPNVILPYSTINGLFTYLSELLDVVVTNNEEVDDDPFQDGGESA
jgi:hypothetical protein